MGTCGLVLPEFTCLSCLTHFGNWVGETALRAIRNLLYWGSLTKCFYLGLWFTFSKYHLARWVVCGYQVVIHPGVTLPLRGDLVHLSSDSEVGKHAASLCVRVLTLPLTIQLMPSQPNLSCVKCLLSQKTLKQTCDSKHLNFFSVVLPVKNARKSTSDSQHCSE